MVASSISTRMHCQVVIILKGSILSFSGTQERAFYFACAICLWFCNYNAHCSCKSCHVSVDKKTGLSFLGCASLVFKDLKMIIIGPVLLILLNSWM